jgi:hypothetical protein
LLRSALEHYVSRGGINAAPQLPLLLTTHSSIPSSYLTLHYQLLRSALEHYVARGGINAAPQPTGYFSHARLGVAVGGATALI